MKSTGILQQAVPDRTVLRYHAGMDAASRTASLEQFMQTTGVIAVATNAFGMGINKPDIRLVVHYNTPGTLEAYYQEAGRGGRDGRPARCIILFSYQDRFIQEFFIDKLGEDSPQADLAQIEKRKQHAREKLELMTQFATTHRCRRQMILDYFGDDAEVSDCGCDVCRKGQNTPLARRRGQCRRRGGRPRPANSFRHRPMPRQIRHRRRRGGSGRFHQRTNARNGDLTSSPHSAC